MPTAEGAIGSHSNIRLTSTAIATNDLFCVKAA